MPPSLSPFLSGYSFGAPLLRKKRRWRLVAALVAIVVHSILLIPAMYALHFLLPQYLFSFVYLEATQPWTAALLIGALVLPPRNLALFLFVYVLFFVPYTLDCLVYYEVPINLDILIPSLWCMTVLLCPFDDLSHRQKRIVSVTGASLRVIAALAWSIFYYIVVLNNDILTSYWDLALFFQHAPALLLTGAIFPVFGASLKTWMQSHFFVNLRIETENS